MADSLVAPVVPPPAQVSGSRRKRTELPLVFWAYRRDTKRLHGAFLVSACRRAEGADDCTWTVSRWVELAEDVSVDKQSVQWQQNFVNGSFYRPRGNSF